MPIRVEAEKVQRMTWPFLFVQPPADIRGQQSPKQDKYRHDVEFSKYKYKVKYEYKDNCNDKYKYKPVKTGDNNHHNKTNIDTSGWSLPNLCM